MPFAFLLFAMILIILVIVIILIILPIVGMLIFFVEHPPQALATAGGTGVTGSGCSRRH